jgi:hypothetical protein
MLRIFLFRCFFGSVGAAFGFVPVFVSNAAMLVAGGRDNEAEE